jgi:hypothetical protein
MEMYKYLGAKSYEIIQCPGGYDDFIQFDRLDGTPRKTDWKPILVKRVRPSLREGNRPADLPSRVGTLILRRSALDALRDMLEANGELLPLATDDGVELYVHNMRTIDALDWERSMFDSYEEFNPRPWMKKPAFIASALEGVDIFKQARVSNDLYVSDRFVARVKAAKLKGLEFTKVWSSED